MSQISLTQILARPQIAFFSSPFSSLSSFISSIAVICHQQRGEKEEEAAAAAKGGRGNSSSWNQSRSSICQIWKGSIGNGTHRQWVPSLPPSLFIFIY